MKTKNKKPSKKTYYQRLIEADARARKRYVNEYIAIDMRTRRTVAHSSRAREFHRMLRKANKETILVTSGRPVRCRV